MVTVAKALRMSLASLADDGLLIQSLCRGESRPVDAEPFVSLEAMESVLETVVSIAHTLLRIDMVCSTAKRMGKSSLTET